MKSMRTLGWLLWVRRMQSLHDAVMTTKVPQNKEVFKVLPCVWMFNYYFFCSCPGALKVSTCKGQIRRKRCSHLFWFLNWRCLKLSKQNLIRLRAKKQTNHNKQYISQHHRHDSHIQHICALMLLFSSPLGKLLIHIIKREWLKTFSKWAIIQNIILQLMTEEAEL